MELSCFRIMCGYAMVLVSSSLLAYAAEPKSEPKNSVETPAPIVGVGVALNSQKRPLGYEVSRIVLNTPAALSGEIQPGDVLTGVWTDETADEVNVAGMEFDGLLKLIRGPLDSVVRLRIVPNQSQFVKEKVVALKRRRLFGDSIIGKKFEATLTDTETRKALTLERFEDRTVLMMLWSSEHAEDLMDVFTMLEGLTGREAIFENVELIAVNCDESVVAADTNSQNFQIQGLRHVWLDPKAAKSVSSGQLPLFVIVSPKGLVDAVSPPDAINLEKFLLQYAPRNKPAH